MSDLFGNHIVGFPTRTYVSYVGHEDQLECPTTAWLKHKDMTPSEKLEKPETEPTTLGLQGKLLNSFKAGVPFMGRRQTE